VLLVDEATHDLDPLGAQRIRSLVRDAADRGAAVLWATQRIDEIRGFADHVTLLNRGQVRFDGSVTAFMATSPLRRYLLHLRDAAERSGAGAIGAGDTADASSLLARAQRALTGLGRIVPTTDAEAGHFLMALDDDVPLGAALRAVMSAGVELLACREERSEIEEAFLALADTEG
jgi:ABC-type multidrug transport system ATPase subunit